MNVGREVMDNMDESSLADEQVDEAIQQMIEHCKLLEETNYHVVSARGVLNTLGYHDEIDQLHILRDIADRGFDYCLDPWIPMTGHHEARGELPHSDVCYWGPDQLRSRLHCLRSR
jgi:hypothetical protein